MVDGPLKSYREMIAAGELRPDPAQLLAVEKLQLLANRLASYTPPARTDWFSFFTRRRGEVPRGLYMFGGVGRGKTMLMDLFHHSVDFEPRRRVHFHAFMADVHDRISRVRRRHDKDPLPIVAGELAAQARLLCFDEFHVTDIADAMILGRLFEGLFALEVVVVATSNAAPRQLYRDGLNRQLFVPFIDLLEDNMEVLMLEANRDYRQDKLEGSPLYFTPPDADARRAMRDLWQRLTGVEEGAPTCLDVKGRRVAVPEAHGGAAYFGFADLCEVPLGANDYLTIAGDFHTVFIEAIPRMGREKRNEARRFVSLIDALYDNRVRLIASAEAEPDGLYVAGHGADLFERTASRLIEMRSEAYIEGPVQM